MIRPATEADLDRLVEIHMASYPDDRGAPARRLNFVQNAMSRSGSPLEDLRVLERGGRVVGQAFGFDLAAWFAGRVVPVLGIASVAVAPEARGSGVAAELLRGLEDEARGFLGSKSIKWNFTKFLVGRDGRVIRRFAPAVKPEALDRVIVRAL